MFAKDASTSTATMVKAGFSSNIRAPWPPPGLGAHGLITISDWKEKWESEIAELRKGQAAAAARSVD